MHYKRPRKFTEEYYGSFYTPPDDVLIAIGKVATTCASIEDIMHFVHWRYVDTLWEIAPILTTDMKPSRLGDDIIKIATAAEEEPERIEDLKKLFADYRELSEKRNQIMHWIWHPPKHRRAKKNPRLSLEPPAYKPKKPETSFTAKEINELADDLAWVEVRMRVHAMSEESYAEETKNIRGYWTRYIYPTPWRGRWFQPNPKRSPRPSGRKRR